MTMNATVIRILGPQRLLVRDNATGNEVVVHARNASAFRAGEVVRITYTGQMTFSNPPQISANSIVRIRPSAPNLPSQTEIRRAQILSVQRGRLSVRDPATQRIMNVNYPYAHHFCVRQLVNIRYDSLSLSNPPLITATEITPLCCHIEVARCIHIFWAQTFDLGKRKNSRERGTVENLCNRMVAAGYLEKPLELSHEVMNEPFYAGVFLVKRLSGTLDRLPITVPGKLLQSMELPAGQLMQIEGQVRSYNKVVDGAGRLMITLFVQRVSLDVGNDTENRVEIVGAICKPPVYRSTPFGREICDLMLAVNRAFGKSDYIPCIAWGRNAQYAARFSVGDRLRICGRLQSREYQKLLESGEYLQRNAFEVSSFTIEAEPGAQIAAAQTEGQAMVSFS